MSLVNVKVKDLTDDMLVFLDGMWFTWAALADSVKATMKPERYYVVATVNTKGSN